MRLPPRYSVAADLPAARDELMKYLFRLTGREAAQDGWPVTLTLLPPRDGAPEYCGDERFSISVSEDGAFLSARGARGCMFAVYAFFEDFLGCRFLTPDAEYLPETPELRVGEKNYAPAFLYREVYARGALNGPFALKLRLNSARAQIQDQMGGRVSFFNYSHTFAELVPPEKYFDAHPEYFSFFNGRRQKEKSQLCLTNEDVFNICLAGVRAQMRAHPECKIFSVAQNDWYGFCECDACRAIDEKEGSHAGTVIRFVNRLAQALQEEFPDCYLHTFAYLYSRTPPKFTRPARHVIVRLCSIESCFSHPMRVCDSAIARIDVEMGGARGFETGERLFREDLACWGRIAPDLFIWDYTTDFANYLQPFPNLPVLGDNLRLMRENGVRGVFEQGNYAPGATSAFSCLTTYVLAHLLWNPDADTDALSGEFLRLYFGPAEQALKKYLRVMEESAARAHMGIFDAPDAPAVSNEALKKGRAFMREALAACETDAQRRRVRLEALSPEYLYLTRLPLDAKGRAQAVDAFAREARLLGVSELFERRAFEQSVDCMKKSRFCKDRSGVPYSVYRL